MGDPSGVRPSDGRARHPSPEHPAPEADFLSRPPLQHLPPNCPPQLLHSWEVFSLYSQQTCQTSPFQPVPHSPAPLPPPYSSPPCFSAPPCPRLWEAAGGSQSARGEGKGRVRRVPQPRALLGPAPGPRTRPPLSSAPAAPGRTAPSRESRRLTVATATPRPPCPRPRPGPAPLPPPPPALISSPERARRETQALAAPSALRLRRALLARDGPPRRRRSHRLPAAAVAALALKPALALQPAPPRARAGPAASLATAPAGGRALTMLPPAPSLLGLLLLLLLCPAHVGGLWW